MTQQRLECGTCGEHSEKCEQVCLMEAATKQIVYFEDEELDRFAGRASCDFSSDEIEEFRYVLYTMRQDEVAEWNHSLVLRGINLPDVLKDEVMLLLND